MLQYTSRITYDKMKNFIVLFIVMIQLTSCNDVFEKDISNEELTVVLPEDNDTTFVYAVQFLFEQLEGASGYEIQIVSPSFDNVQNYVIDSVFSENNFTIQLDPGLYQWRARAVNFAYQTPFIQPRNLFLDTTSDLSIQQVQLTQPISGSFTNDTILSFTWLSLPLTDTYDFTLVQGTNVSSGIVVEQSQNLTTSSYINTTSLFEGTYTFGVQAFNSYPSNTPVSQNTFYVDLTSPGDPILNTPTDNSNDNTATNISFQWTQANDLGTIQSTQFDSIYIYSDSLVTLFDKSKSNTSDYSTQFPSTGTYYWRVKTFDDAGNESDFSNTFILNIQ